MNEPLTYLTAYLLGLIGSVHCMGMCGGIVGALSMNTRNQGYMNLQLAYHLGRIITYGALGFTAGLLGLWLSSSHHYVGVFLRSLSGVLLVLMGVYLFGNSQALNWLEKLGGQLWKKIQPLSKNLIPVKNAKQGVLLGLIWGLLPCGLVYSTLSWALVSADPMKSATLMMAFGLGNLPALLSFGLFTKQLTRFKQSVSVRALLAICIMGFGIWTIYAALSSPL